MVPDPIHRRLAQRYGIRSMVPLSSGMSGASLFRCLGEHSWVLRRWPESTTPSRVREIHAAIIPAASTCDLFPKYFPIDESGYMHCVDDRGSIWDFSTWMPGQALAVDAAEPSIRAGAEAIRLAHRALAPIACCSDRAPAVLERLQRIDWLSRRLPACLDKGVCSPVAPAVAGPLESACRLLRRHWSVVAEQLSDGLTAWSEVRLPLQICLRDCHREHVLFSGTRATGIIDFDAIRIDSPAVDLARWVTSFSAFDRDPESILDGVLADDGAIPPFSTAGSVTGTDLLLTADHRLAGASSEPLTADFRKLTLDLAVCSLWISTANWVVWLIGESRQFPDFERVSQRLSRLVESVDVWSKR